MWLSLRFREAASVAEHRELGIPIRHGRGRHKAEQFYVRFCFPHATAADAFRDRFGGERLRYTSQKPESRARVFDATERRIISTRIADAQVSPGGAKRDPSHKHMSLSTDTQFTEGGLARLQRRQSASAFLLSAGTRLVAC